MPEDPETELPGGSAPYPGSGPQPGAQTQGPPPYPQQPQAPPAYPQQPQYPGGPQPYPQQPAQGGYAPGGYPPAGSPPGAYPPGGYQAPYGQPVAPVSPYASYGARLGGWLIDWVIIVIVSTILDVIFNAAKIANVTFHSNTTTNGVTTYHVTTFSFLGPILHVLIVLLYGGIMCGSARGQTVGMMAVGARAVDRDTAQPIGFGRALGRAAFEYLLFILLFIPWVIDMLFPAWDEKKQTLHDKVSRTVVVKNTVVPAPA